MTGTGGTGAAPGPRRRRRRTLGTALVEAGAVLGMSLRLLVRHWPVLFALYFAGAAGREFAVLGAVQASKVNGVLGLLVVILGPIATLTALVLMLRAVRPSLPWLSAATTTAGPQWTTTPGPMEGAAADPAHTTGPDPAVRPSTLLDHLGSALVPFLAVYASWGYLQADIVNYFYAVFVDTNLADAAIFTDPAAVAANSERRMPLSLTTTMVAVVVVAVAVRWLLTRWQGRPRMGWLGIAGAYVEVIWITIVAGAVSQAQDPVLQWVRERRIVIWLLDLWHESVSRLGPLAEPARTAGEWLVGAVFSVDVVIVVPLAWLAVGAVVYGHRLAPSAPAPSGLLARAARRWQAMPRPVRVVGANLSVDLRERFAPLIHGLRLMVRAGLAPMLFFCLTFLLAQTAREWLWEAERFVIGPRDLESVWIPLSGPLSILNDAVGTVLLACLLGAAVDRVLRVQPPAPPDAEAPETELPGPDGQPAESRA